VHQLVNKDLYFLCFCKKECKEKCCIVSRIMGCCMLKIKLKVSSYRPCKHVAMFPTKLCVFARRTSCGNSMTVIQLPSGKMRYYWCISQIYQSQAHHLQSVLTQHLVSSDFWPRDLKKIVEYPMFFSDLTFLCYQSLKYP